MRIGEVAKHSGVGVETVRFYEGKGLIERPRRPKSGGYRDYPEATARRIRFIRSAQRLGFALGEVAELLELETGGGACCSDVRRKAEAKRREVQARIEGLNEVLDALDRLIEACPGKGPATNCSILESINQEGAHFGQKRKGVRDDEREAQD